MRRVLAAVILLGLLLALGHGLLDEAARHRGASLRPESAVPSRHAWRRVRLLPVPVLRHPLASQTRQVRFIDAVLRRRDVRLAGDGGPLLRAATSRRLDPLRVLAVLWVRERDLSAQTLRGASGSPRVSGAAGTGQGDWARVLQRWCARQEGGGAVSAAALSCDDATLLSRGLSRSQVSTVQQLVAAWRVEYDWLPNSTPVLGGGGGFGSHAPLA